MKYRSHRGGLAESMETVVELQPTLDALAVYLKVPASRITVEPYSYDKRIGWNTHIVCIDGGACGFTDGPLEPPMQMSPSDKAWFHWIDTRPRESSERAAFDAGTRHGIEFANSQLVDYDALAAENAKLREALTRIACFDDIEANITLEKHGSYASFDEPGAAYIARTALAPTLQPSGERT